jgi:hypothetical protein
VYIISNFGEKVKRFELFLRVLQDDVFDLRHDWIIVGVGDLDGTVSFNGLEVIEDSIDALAGFKAFAEGKIA